MTEIDYDQLYYAYKLLWEAGREVEEEDSANDGAPIPETLTSKPECEINS